MPSTANSSCVHAPQLGLLRVELVLDVADQFLEHVVERHDAGRAAELIHHQREMRVLGEEKAEQLLQRHHLRHGVQFALDALQIRLRLAHQLQQILDVDEPDRVIEMPSAERKPRVPALDRRLQVLLEGILGIQEDDLAARRGDVAHHALAQVERVDEHFLAERRDFLGRCALGEDHAQFLLAVRQFVLARRLDAKDDA